MLAREKLDLDRHRNMPVTQQFSVNAITLGGRSSMDVVKAGSKAAAGAGSTAAVSSPCQTGCNCRDMLSSRRLRNASLP